MDKCRQSCKYLFKGSWELIDCVGNMKFSRYFPSLSLQPWFSSFLPERKDFCNSFFFFFFFYIFMNMLLPWIGLDANNSNNSFNQISVVLSTTLAKLFKGKQGRHRHQNCRICFFSHFGVSPSTPVQIVLFSAAVVEIRYAVLTWNSSYSITRSTLVFWVH